MSPENSAANPTDVETSASDMIEGNTVGIEPSEVVIELDTLTPQERENILWETSNSTDTESLREAIQEAIQLLEDKQNGQNTEVVHISSDFVQRVKTARETSLQSTDVPTPPTFK